jgi:hypothetical protein
MDFIKLESLRNAEDITDIGSWHAGDGLLSYATPGDHGKRSG